MTGSSSIIENQPFEVRCDIAIQTLTKTRGEIQKILDDDLLHMQKKTQDFKSFASKSENPVVQELVEEWLQQDIELIKRSSEGMLKITWEHSVSICRILCGSDATDFALANLKHNHEGS